MEQPNFSNTSQPPQPPPLPPSNPTINNNNNNNNNKKQKIKIPTPQELITHYESQGMNTQEASIKVIDDLQHTLFRVITSRKGRKDKFMGEASRKLDAACNRLAIVEKKVDSKPGYTESFVIGVAGASAARGVFAVWPQVAGGFVSVWNSVRGVSQT
ncbi:uncharacterized protein LOC141621169 [Silene latifolia]|uniref:uncharacterized protein LOC141621169 n=1 Tax=Silene latifolia TaxID=37657 RepID=UPI003D777B66